MANYLQTGPEETEDRWTIHSEDMCTYVLPFCGDSAIIAAAHKLQRDIDRHERLPQYERSTRDCSETELLDGRRSWLCWYKNVGCNGNIDDTRRNNYNQVVAGGWTHYLTTSLTRGRHEVWPPISSSGSHIRYRDDDYDRDRSYKRSRR